MEMGRKGKLSTFTVLLEDEMVLVLEGTGCTEGRGWPGSTGSTGLMRFCTYNALLSAILLCTSWLITP